MSGNSEIRERFGISVHHEIIKLCTKHKRIVIPHNDFDLRSADFGIIDTCAVADIKSGIRFGMSQANWDNI